MNNTKGIKTSLKIFLSLVLLGFIILLSIQEEDNLLLEDDFILEHKNLLRENSNQIQNNLNTCSDSVKNVSFLFIHTEKTGGSSIENTFNNFGKYEKDLNHRAFIEARHASKLTEHDHHVSFNTTRGHPTMLQILEENNCKTISDCIINTSNFCQNWIIFFRNPVNRLISAFYHAKSSIGDVKGHFNCPRNSLATFISTKKESTIEDWANLHKTERDKCQVFNRMTFLLVPIKRDGKKGKFHDYKQDTVENQFLVLKQVLDDLPFIGIMERYEDSMMLLSHTFNLKLIKYLPMYNFNPYNHTVSEKTVNILKQYTKLDQMVYDYSVKLFDKRFNLMLQKLARDITPKEVFTVNNKQKDDIVCAANNKNSVFFNLKKENPPEKWLRLVSEGINPSEMTRCMPLEGVSRESSF